MITCDLEIALKVDKSVFVSVEFCDGEVIPIAFGVDVGIIGRSVVNEVKTFRVSGAGVDVGASKDAGKLTFEV